MTLAVATIVAKNTLAVARALAASLHRLHPDLSCQVLLADRIDGFFDPAREPFALTELSALVGLPAAERRQLTFRHPQPDLSYALTPWFLAHLLDHGHTRVLFLKQESLVVGDLRPLFATLAEAPILLTPHLLAPLAGPAATTRELGVLLAGAYNAGVVGVSDRPLARQFLTWWQTRLAAHCRLATAEGLHYEQRWLDLVPSYFPGTAIVREAGANLGHWGYPERHVQAHDGRLTVCGRPLRVARFSGYQPTRPQHPSRHAERLRVTDLGPVAVALFEHYRNALRHHAHAACSRWPAAWAQFHDGVTIPPLVRRLHAELDPGVAIRLGDPFAAGGGSFRAWLFGDDAGTPRLWRQVWRRRPDLQRAFPDPGGTDRDAFARWVAVDGVAEYGCAELVRVATAEAAR